MKRKLFSLTHEGLVLFLIIISVPLQLNFGQLSSEFLRFKQHDKYLQNIDSSRLQGRSFPWENDYQQNNGISVQNNNKAGSGFIALIDSVYEIQNFGYFSELYRWYYQYNEQQKVDSVWRYYYNFAGEFENVTEIRSYNTNGQIVRLVKRQPDFIQWQYYGDSTVIEYYTEEYTYQGNNLVKKMIRTTSYGIFYYTEIYHTYDSNNHLIRDSTISDDYSPEITTYTYNAENKMEYKLYLSDGQIYGVNKYEYEITDTSQLITQHWIYYNQLPENPIPDTITYWQGERYYYETYDYLGRKIALRVKYYNIYNGLNILYRAEYNYTDNNDLLHASYYDWIGEPESGYWQEATGIDNTYDADGNLELYAKTFYDARTEMWETDNSKTYYYTLVPVGLPEEFVNPDQLIIFPNPADNVITIKNFFNGYSYYTIYNLCGVALECESLDDSKIIVSQLKAGIYIIEIRNSNSISSGRFVKY